MSFNDVIILLIIGLSAGIVSGAMGIGGAIIIVPALVLFFGMTQHQAQDTSLDILVFPIGLLAFLNYYKSGYVNFKFAIVVMLAFFIGGYIGSKFAINLPDKALKAVFGVLLMLVGLKMVLGK